MGAGASAREQGAGEDFLNQGIVRPFLATRYSQYSTNRCTWYRGQTPLGPSSGSVLPFGEVGIPFQATAAVFDQAGEPQAAFY